MLCFCADILIGLLRLRKCSKDAFRSELKGGVSVVRELHVYPLLVIKIGTHSDTKQPHREVGRENE